MQRSNDSCIIGYTLITLENSKEIPAAELNDDDNIRNWDFLNGEITSAHLTGFYKHIHDEELM